MANLLTPLQVKSMSLENRLVLPPMATEKATSEGIVTPEQVEHYARYARAGVGLIITEHAFVEARGRVSPRQLSVADDAMIPGLTELAAGVHEAGGVIGVQINHAGMAGRPELVGEVVGPSAMRHPRREEGATARELTREEIQQLVSTYADAARRVKQAGFDMVEIHSAHGYLICQFNSPLSNQRTDEYGGSLEKRLTFGREVITAVRKEVGDNFPILFRLGADDLLPGGLTIEDAAIAAPLFVEAGADILDLSGGFGGYRAEGEEGYFVYMAEALKKVVNVPLITTGGVLSAAFADRVIREGRADLVGVGRAMLNDYAWAERELAELRNRG